VAASLQQAKWQRKSANGSHQRNINQLSNMAAASTKRSVKKTGISGSNFSENSASEIRRGGERRQAEKAVAKAAQYQRIWRNQ